MIVSSIDLDLMDFNWYINNGYYARTIRSKGSIRHTQYLHRVILERMLGRSLVEGETVDHIDNDKLNNQRDNLRLATQSENNYNVGKQSNNTSGYKGVTWHKKDQRWQAQISVGKSYKYLGQFDSREAAYEAYKQAAIKLHGEFVKLD